ncbi:hypothetical protein F5B17DRAFT_405386 [Nemania serpens]|nr:hypothetical protein F5B17DRAFT_405386 [Nemania serpens]
MPNSDRKLPMQRSRENKDFQGKAEPKLKGLMIDTKLAQDTQHVSFAVDNRVARKATNADVPRLSEAMMNTNWRRPQHSTEESSSDMIEPWTAPPEKSKFVDEVKIKHQREEKHDCVDYDHGLSRVAYRCRRPEDVKPELVPFTRPESVSADLCLSAPATKTEYSEAEVGTEERAAKYDPSVFQPSIKSIVRLDDMAPTQRAGFEKILNWNEQHAGLERGRRWGIGDSSSITTVSLVDNSSSWESVEFPYAEIRAVKSGRKFEIELNGVEEIIRNQLSALVEPQSAGLPPDYLRKLYEEKREERRKAMILAESTIGARGRSDGVHSKQEEPGMEGVDNPHFNDLLGKLNKLCAPRLRAFTVNDKDEACIPSPANRTQNATEVEPQRSPSGDSAISGLSPAGRKRASTLNPNAVEFRCSSTQEKESPVANASDPGQVPVANKISEPTDPIRQLEARVAELEAQIARHASEKVKFPHQTSAKGCEPNHTPYVAKSYGFGLPSGGAPHPAMNGGIRSPVVFSPHPLLPGLPGLAVGAGGMYPSPVPVPVTGQNGLGLPFNGTPTGFADQGNNAPAMIPPQGRGALAPPKPALGTPLWVKSMFGPKPVSKPDRPFRPGDGIQAMRQQEYEEYLEHLRATDPNYALNCKQRQARRADRQRLGQKRLLC